MGTRVGPASMGMVMEVGGGGGDGGVEGRVGGPGSPGKWGIYVRHSDHTAPRLPIDVDRTDCCVTLCIMLLKRLRFYFWSF